MLTAAPEAPRGMTLRHAGIWAVENWHASSVLGEAWTRQRRAPGDGDWPNLETLRGGEPSAEWRSAQRTARGRVLLSSMERALVLTAREAEAEGEAERNQVRLVQMAVRIELERAARGGAAA